MRWTPGAASNERVRVLVTLDGDVGALTVAGWHTSASAASRKSSSRVRSYAVSRSATTARPPGPPCSSALESVAMRVAPTVSLLPLSLWARRRRSSSVPAFDRLAQLADQRRRRRVEDGPQLVGHAAVVDVEAAHARLVDERPGLGGAVGRGDAHPALEHGVEVLGSAAAWRGSRPCRRAGSARGRPSIACAVIAMIGRRTPPDSPARIRAVAS